MPATTVIQIRRGTAAQWTAANPILAASEPGLETDTKRIKYGDGVSTWTALPYFGTDIDHVHPSTDISDSTAIGRSVLSAASTAAARTAIGAGTSSIVVGSGAGDAKAGNWVPSFAEVTGQLGTSQLPPLAINEVYTAASQTAMLALVAQRGDMAIRTDIGETYVLATDSPAVLADWKMITSPGNVTSVAGRQGAVVLAKADVGLSAVDNTSDANKPVSTAAQTALNAKANLASPTFTGTVSGVTAAMVGLGSVNNTADTAKPVSTAQQSALNAKENTIAAGTIGQYYRGDKTWATNDKASVGLNNVDNTSDANKPVSTATQTALSGKESTVATGSTAQYYRGDKTWQPTNAIVLTSVDGGTP